MDDKTKIQACIQLYFDSMYESDANKVKSSFHDAAMISGYLPDGLHEMNLDDFAGFVSSQQPSPKENNDEICNFFKCFHCFDLPLLERI